MFCTLLRQEQILFRDFPWRLFALTVSLCVVKASFRDYIGKSRTIQVVLLSILVEFIPPGNCAGTAVASSKSVFE